MNAAVFNQTEFTINRKFWKFFGESVRVLDPAQNLLLFAKLKAFKLKEDIRLYADEAQTEEIIVVKARQIIDIGAVYDVFDSKTQERLGSVKRKGWKSLMRDEWEVWDSSEQVIARITEDSLLLALIRRFIIELIPQTFTMQNPQGAPLATMKQNFNPFTVRLHCSLQQQDAIDPRMSMVAMILLAVIEGRQG